MCSLKRLKPSPQLRCCYDDDDDDDDDNNNSSFISTADNPQLICFYNKLSRRTAQIQSNTKNQCSVQPNITTWISMGGRQLQVSAKVDHNAVN